MFLDKRVNSSSQFSAIPGQDPLRNSLLLLQMNHSRSQCVIRRQRLTAGDILQIKSHAIGYPGAGCLRSTAGPRGEERTGRASDMNLDDLGVGRFPGERGGSHQGAPRDRYGIWTGWQLYSLSPHLDAHPPAPDSLRGAIYG